MNFNSTSRANQQLHSADTGDEVCPELKEIIRRVRASSSDQILRRRDLPGKCGRGYSTSFVDVARGEFPPPFPIGKRAIGFSSNEVDAWIAARSYSSQRKIPVNMKAFVSLLVRSRNILP